MAHANFISRTSQSLLQILKTRDLELLLDRLNAITVAIVYTEASLSLSNASVLMQAAINMMSRLYPKIAIIYKGNGPRGESFKADLIRTAKAINPNIEIVNGNFGLNAAFCIGAKSVTADLCVFVNADGWCFEVVKNEEATLLGGNHYNPIVAVAAACFGLSEVFNFIFKDIIPRQKKENSYVYSLLDYSSGTSHIEELSPIHLKDLSLVGLGAIGNSTAWCLSKLTSLTGSLYLIDDEKVELSNLQRYFLTDQESVNKVKTQIAKECFNHSGLSVFPIPKTLSEYAKDRGPDFRFDLIAISVDNAEDRVAAQALLPKKILNAWTGENGYCGTSRHYFDNGSQACLSCLYLKHEKQKSDVDKLVDVTGLDSRMVAEILVRKIPLSSDHIAAIAIAKNYPLAIIKQWEGRLITDFYAQAICGGILLKQDKDQTIKQLEAIVPIVHQSVLAGALLAAEIVKHYLKLSSLSDNVEIKMDIFSKPGSYACQRRPKTLNPKCICTDEDFISLYKKKY